MGEEDDDIFQVVTDRLPATKAAQRRVGPAGQETLIPTYTDRFDGGSGVDQVLYLGGDLDTNGRVVPDNVSMRWNTILHRYEMTSQVWNFQQQTWENDLIDGPAEIIGASSAPTNGQLTGDLSFAVSVDGGPTRTITVPRATAQLNASFDQLVFQINEAIRQAGLRGKLSARNLDGKLSLTTLSRGGSARLVTSNLNPVAVNDLGLTAQTADGQTDNLLPQQNYAFYTVFDTEDTTRPSSIRGVEMMKFAPIQST